MNPSQKKTLRIGILGAGGRTGRELKTILENDFASETTLTSSPAQGDDLAPLLECDAVIDFSTREATLNLLDLALTKNDPHFVWIIGTTGFTLDERRRLEGFAESNPVLLASNFSLGVMALSEVLKSAAPLFERLKFKPLLTETHHQGKKDAPSGTALSLQRIISPLGPGNVPTKSVREGDVVGKHELVYSGPSEQVVFMHEALDRAVFARGAIEAALWLYANRRRFKELVQGSTPLITADTFFSSRFGTKQSLPTPSPWVIDGV